MSDTLFEYYHNASAGNMFGAWSQREWNDPGQGTHYQDWSQTFVAESSHTLTSVKLYLSSYTAHGKMLYDTGGAIAVGIYATDAGHLPTGIALGMKIVTVGIISTGWMEFAFSSLQLEKDVEYAITLSYFVSQVLIQGGVFWWGKGFVFPETGYVAVGNSSFDDFPVHPDMEWTLGNVTAGSHTLFEVYGTGDPPEKPENVTPADEAEDVEGSAYLEWLDPGAEADNAATGFNLYFGSSEATLGLIASGLTAEQVTATAKQVNGQYYSAGADYAWRVDAFNDAGTTTGDVWTFNVVSQPSFDPDRPTDPEDPDNLDPDGRLEDDYDLTISGGGRHSRYLVVVGHKTVYIKKA